MRVFNWYIPLDELRGRQETFKWLDDFEHTDVCVGSLVKIMMNVCLNFFVSLGLLISAVGRLLKY